MKNYINPTTKQIFAFEGDGSQDFLIVPPLVAISDADLAKLRAEQAAAIVPASVSMRQARLALVNAPGGLYTKVQAAVEVADQATQVEWEFASRVERNSPLVATLGAALGLDAAALDALFIKARSL